MNVKYYGCKLEGIRRINFFLDLILLVSAPTSAVAGLWLWKTDIGEYTWKIMGVVAAISSIIRPLINQFIPSRPYENILAGYKSLLFELNEIKTSIEQKRAFDDAIQVSFEKTKQLEKLLIEKDPEAKPNSKLIKKCTAEVNIELPVDSFYVPEDNHVSTATATATATTTPTPTAAAS